LKVAQCAACFTACATLECILHQIDHCIEVHPATGRYTTREESDDLFPCPYPELIVQGIVTGDPHKKNVARIVSEERLTLPGFWGEMVDVPFAKAPPILDLNVGLIA